MRRALAVAALVVALPVFAASGPSLVDQLDREIIALKQKVARLEGQLESCGTSSGDPGPIFQELVQVYSGGPVKVDRQGAAVRVTLPVDVLFSQDALSLRQEADFALDLLATALRLHPDARVTIVGHTDAQPPSPPLRKLLPDNWSLSVTRALIVSDALQKRFGIAPARMTVAGRADVEPVASNDTPETRALNRRIVVLVTSGGSP